MQFDFSLAGGEVNETKEGEALLCRTYFRIKVLLGDKAYDTDKIRKSCAELVIKACIPPKSNRKNPAAFDKVLYKERRVIENMFGQLKDWHGIAMRFCRSAHAFCSLVCLGLIQISMSADLIQKFLWITNHLFSYNSL